MSLTNTLKVVFTISLACGSTAKAEGLMSGWTSATHFGYSTESQSTTGFKKSSGSTIFLDASKQIWKKTSLGLRTVGCGGQANSGEFYRLGTGPLVSYRASQKWNFDLSASFFQESGLDEDGDSVYSSKGQNIQIGWQRIFTLRPGLELSWGGFLGRHWGKLDLDSAVSNTSKLYQTSRNDGSSHGVEIALRISI